MTTSLFSAPRCAIEPHPQGCSVLSPYNPEFVEALKSRVPMSARVWDRESKRWLVDITYAPVVAQLIEQYYGEQVIVPALSSGPDTSEQVEIKVEYVGTLKEREDGTRSAFGFYNGGWNVIFPEVVLRTFFKDFQESTGARGTFYEALGVDRKANAQEIKSAFRRMARQWHPDLCREPDAAEQFQRIDRAYKLLSDSTLKKKYDAGLAFEDSLHRQRKRHYIADNYRTPLRSGLLLVSARNRFGRLIVDEIHSWGDIVDEMGRVHVASWPRGGDHFRVTWVGSVPEDDLDCPF